MTKHLRTKVEIEVLTELHVSVGVGLALQVLHALCIITRALVTLEKL